MAGGFRRSRALEYKLRSSRALSASGESAGRPICSAEREAGRSRNTRPILWTARVPAKPAAARDCSDTTPPQQRQSQGCRRGLDDILSIKYRTIYAEFCKFKPAPKFHCRSAADCAKRRRISAVGRFGRTHTDY
jgi:hypothetical protein